MPKNGRQETYRARLMICFFATARGDPLLELNPTFCKLRTAGRIMSVSGRRRMMVTGMIGLDSGSDDLLLPTADRAEGSTKEGEEL